MIVEYFRRRALVACVAAELKAQCKDQEVVEQVCFTTTGVRMIADFGKYRFPEKGKLRYFMITTFLLADTLTRPGIRLNVKSVAWVCLCRRRVKIDQHMQLGTGRVMIKEEDVRDLDELINVGITTFENDKRTFLLKEIHSHTGLPFE